MAAPGHSRRGPFVRFQGTADILRARRDAMRQILSCSSYLSGSGYMGV